MTVADRVSHLRELPERDVLDTALAAIAVLSKLYEEPRVEAFYGANRVHRELEQIEAARFPRPEPVAQKVLKPRSVIRSDDDGIFVQAGGYHARPGAVAGYSHAYDMGDGGLREGDRVHARHLSQTNLIRVTRQDGHRLHWRIFRTYQGGPA